MCLFVCTLYSCYLYCSTMMNLLHLTEYILHLALYFHVNYILVYTYELSMQ